MKPVTLNLLKQYRMNLLSMLTFVAIESWVLYKLKDQFVNFNYVIFIIILQFVPLMANVIFLTRMQVLDENGITVKRLLNQTTYGWDRISEYGICESTKGFKKRTVIRAQIDGSSKSVELEYSQEAFNWMQHRCGAPAYDKRK